MKAYKLREGLLVQAAGSETLTAIAHDLRAPMCCVSGAAQMALLASRQGKTVDDQLRQILLAVETMDRMLGQMCRGENGIQSCTAVQMEEELHMVMTPRAAAKRQLLRVDLSALYGTELSALLSRVLLNLISNAIKYTQEGGSVNVCADREEGFAVFTVSDNGMGMTKAFIRRMYVPFERAKESAHLPGKGIGLSIVRRLVRQMGGTIGVKSAWGKGTTFTVRVPLGTNRLQ